MPWFFTRLATQTYKRIILIMTQASTLNPIYRSTTPICLFEEIVDLLVALHGF